MRMPKFLDHSGLGESWVDASADSPQEQQGPESEPGDERQHQHQHPNDPSTMSARLIMPVIDEANEAPSSESQRAGAAGGPVGEDDTRGFLASIGAFLRYPMVRCIVKSFLIAFALYLLVVPKVIYHAQSLCSVPRLKEVYPGSCIRLEAEPTNPEEAITAMQTNLECIFNSANATLTSLAPTLKESKAMHKELLPTMQDSFPDMRSYLAWEFKGGQHALRVAIWELEIIRADIRATLEYILASRTSIVSDSRLSLQMIRRAKYLDKVRAVLRMRTETLAREFRNLESHFRALEKIMSDEVQRVDQAKIKAAKQSVGSRRFSFELETLERKLFGGPEVPHPATTLEKLKLVATHHLPVVDSVERMSQQLKDFPTWGNLRVQYGVREGNVHS